MSQRTRRSSTTRRSSPTGRGSTTHRSSGPLVFGAIALLAMLLVAVWAIRGLIQSSESPTVPAGATTPLPTLPVGLATPASTAERTPSVSEATPPSERPTPTPSPTPPPPVVVGSFGELPAPNLPQPAFPPGQLTIDYEQAFDSAVIPTEAPVYRLVSQRWDEARVAALAQSLGIEGTVQRTASGFLVRGTTGQLVVSDLTVQYQRAEFPATTATATATPGESVTPTPQLAPTRAGESPTEADLLARARSWLLEHGLVSTPPDQGTIRERVGSDGLVIAAFGPTEPRPVLSAIPSATVALTTDGTVREAFVAWPAALEASSYSLRPASALWEDVVRGRGIVEVDESVFARARLPLQGTARMTTVELAWVDAGQGGERYLTPVVRFSGEATFEGLDQPVSIRVTVAAVAAQAAPRG